MSTEPLWCRHLGCIERATFQARVIAWSRWGLPRKVVREVAYCDEHLTKATETIDKNPAITISNVRPIKKEENMDKEVNAGPVCTCDMTEAGQRNCPAHGERNPGPYPGPPLTADHEITQLKDRITRLQADVNRQGEAILQRNERINGLEHSNSEMKVTLRNRDARVASLLETQNALVGSLHVLADNAEDEGQQDLAEEVDALLAEYDLRPRKQEYTIEILVPVRLHLHVTARSMNHARTLYEAGSVDWNVADGEVQDDDIKVLDISEGSL